MSNKLLLDDANGTIVIPLVGKDRPTERVTLREPSLDELYSLQLISQEADAKMAAMSLEERRKVQYTADGEYVKALLQIIAMLGDAETAPETKHLPGFAGNGSTLATIQQWFQAPLDGLGSAMLVRTLG